jgi:MYXO-CTERM domain-containing protein/uncharacterized repeat protein (TIGR01451 family)
VKKTAWAAIGALLVPSTSHANEPFTKRFEYAGPVDFFATGVPLGVDGPDSDTTMVDILQSSASVDVTSADVPVDATLKAAFLYWGGSITNNNCADLSNMDDVVTFTPPGAAPSSVTADVCYCSDGGGTTTVNSYDLGACRKEVTSLITGGMLGTYTAGDFSALINNGSTNTASWSVILVFSQVGLPARRIGIYDGLLTMGGSGGTGGASQQSIVLDQLEVDQAPPMGSLGDLTWYVMEGDAGGAGTERVDVYGTALGPPGITLSDAVNPAGNPMNHTINTVTPPDTTTIGVDIDRFDISSALAFNDTTVTTVLRAGADKWWPIYNVVGVNVFEPVFEAASSKDWALQDDADNNGVPSPGDTIRYTITLENTGSADGVIDISDPIPAQAASWFVVDVGNGTDASTIDTFVVNDISVTAGTTETVAFDLVIDNVAPFTFMSNTADWDASPEGGMGTVSAPGVIIQAAGDGDGDGDGTTGDGDGDGDGTSGDGDGTSGDGDGTSGDGDGTSGDGDGTSGDGDGTSGDGDGTSGDGDGTSGDGDGSSGDGDGTSGDGDGSSGDGDGTSGDGDGTSGDGDGTSGDGDGTSGDGDGSAGDGDGTSGDGDGSSGDGDGTSGDGDGSSGDGDGDGGTGESGTGGGEDGTDGLGSTTGVLTGDTGEGDAAGDGCACATESDSSGGGLAFFGLAAVGWRRRRRR